MTVAGAPVHEKVLSAQAALDTTHAAIFVASYSLVRIFVVSGAGVASGAVQLEGAATKDYAGTWQAIGAAVTVPAADTVTSQVAINSSYLYVRARISTVVAGGAIDAWIVAN